MASWAYLTSYLSSIPNSQRQQLLNTLYGDLNNGKLASLGEYETRLSTEMASLTTKIGTPTFNLREATKNEITSSANYNDMEAKSITDLTTLYSEAAELDQLVSDHSVIISSKLDSITSAISKMEHRIDVLESLASDTEGYTSSYFNSFAEDNTNKLERYSVTNTDPFIVDGPGYLSEEYDAEVENNTLHLPVEDTVDYRIESASIQNQSPLGVSADFSGDTDYPYSLGNLIDSNNQTYWAETVDINGAAPITAATVQLVVTLLGVQQLSRIIIDPFSNQPYKIKSISYRKNKRSTAEFIPFVTDEILLQGKTLIEFSTIYAEQLLFEIEQNNYSQLRYVTNSKDGTIEKMYNISTGEDIDVDSLDYTDMYFAMSSLMKKKLGITTTLTSESEIIDLYQYTYGIKTLDLEQKQYKNYGIFVTDNILWDLLGAIGLDTSQSESDLTFVEYDIIAKLTSKDGTSMDILQPILPSSTKIVTEILDCSINRLYWEAKTRFGIDSASTIKVMMNNTMELTEGTHYTKTIDPTTSVVTIDIIGTTIGWPTVRTSNFTISYTPNTSAYTVETKKYDNAIINLRIFLRSIDPNKLLTPSVNSFSLKFKTYTES